MSKWKCDICGDDDIERTLSILQGEEDNDNY